jgi:TetR/AcrR family transcriptional regulator, repressor for uid operon
MALDDQQSSTKPAAMLHNATDYSIHDCSFMSRTKDESLHAQRQTDILQAAARVFKAKGFHLARTEDICAEAKLSAGTLFRHFPDKRSMILAIMEIEFEQYKTDVQQLATKDGIQWLAHVRANDLIELMQPKGFDLGADSWLEMARDPADKQRLQVFDKQLRHTLSKELKRGQADGWVRPSLECEGAATLILALFTGLSFEHELGLTHEPKATAKALADLVSGFLLI